MDKKLYLILNYIKIKLCLSRNNKLSTKYIFREVSLLSRLQHPNIVRYYQSWIEDYELFPSEEDQEESFDVTEYNNIEELDSQESEAKKDEDDSIYSKNKMNQGSEVNLIAKFFLKKNFGFYQQYFKIIFSN